MSKNVNKQCVKLSVNASSLSHFYDKHSLEWHNGFPEVKNPEALVEGLEKICRKMCGGIIPEQVIIYVIEDDINPQQDINQAKYFIRIDDVHEEKNMEKAYEVQIVYQPTTQIEAVSAINGEEVIWTADNPSNSKHPYRTIYNMGFTYMICDRSPGFDQEPTPEYVLTGTELLELGVSGELPPDIIEIKLPEEEEVSTEEENEYETTYEEESNLEDEDITSLLNLDEEELDNILMGTGSIELNNISNEEFNEAEEEYNDLMTEFEEIDELFD